MYVRVCSFYTIVSLRFCLLFREKAEKNFRFKISSPPRSSMPLLEMQ